MTREMYRNVEMNFEKSDETHIKSVMLYGHSDNKLYRDAEHTEVLHTSVMKELIGFSILIKDETATYVPVRFTESGNEISAFVKDAASTEKEFKTTADPS